MCLSKDVELTYVGSCAIACVSRGRLTERRGDLNFDDEAIWWIRALSVGLRAVERTESNSSRPSSYHASLRANSSE